MIVSWIIFISLTKDIRDTWGEDALKHGMMFVFHLGVDKSTTTDQQEALEEEIEKNGDILQQNFIDNYQNLTSIFTLLN